MWTDFNNSFTITFTDKVQNRQNKIYLVILNLKFTTHNAPFMFKHMYLRKTSLEEQAFVAGDITPCQLHLFQSTFK